MYAFGKITLLSVALICGTSAALVAQQDPGEDLRAPATPLDRARPLFQHLGPLPTGLPVAPLGIGRAHHKKSMALLGSMAKTTVISAMRITKFLRLEEIRRTRLRPPARSSPCKVHRSKSTSAFSPRLFRMT